MLKEIKDNERGEKIPWQKKLFFDRAPSSVVGPKSKLISLLLLKMIIEMKETLFISYQKISA